MNGIKDNGHSYAKWGNKTDKIVFTQSAVPASALLTKIESDQRRELIRMS